MCGIEFTFADVDSGEMITLVNSDVNVEGVNITIATQLLRENRRYSVTATASNAIGSSTSGFRISVC